MRLAGYPIGLGLAWADPARRAHVVEAGTMARAMQLKR